MNCRYEKFRETKQAALKLRIALEEYFGRQKRKLRKSGRTMKRICAAGCVRRRKN